MGDYIFNWNNASLVVVLEEKWKHPSSHASPLRTDLFVKEFSTKIQSVFKMPSFSKINLYKRKFEAPKSFCKLLISVEVTGTLTFPGQNHVFGLFQAQCWDMTDWRRNLNFTEMKFPPFCSPPSFKHAV